MEPQKWPKRCFEPPKKAVFFIKTHFFKILKGSFNNNIPFNGYHYVDLVQLNLNKYSMIEYDLD